MERELAFGGSRIRLLQVAQDSDGACAVVEMVWPSGFRVPPHIHTREDEATYVVEGALEVAVDGRTFLAAAGEFVRKPRGVPHAMSAAGTGPVRFIEIYTPAGLESYFRDIAEHFNAGSPQPDAIVAIQRRHGIRPA